MEPYKVEMEMNLKTFIAETKEVAQALNKLVDDLEQIEKKYAESQESEAYSFPEVFGEPIEMLIDGVWVKGKVVNDYRSRDGIVNMETEDGKKYWCGCERTECYRKPKEGKNECKTNEEVS